MNARALRLIVIGCGRVFQRYHLPAIGATADVQVVGACEIDAARRAWAQAALPGARLAGSVDELLRSVEADAALITAPPATHATLVELVLRAGLSVLVEKPMAVTPREARRVCELQQETGRVLRVGFNRRYRADYVRLRERARDGVGTIAFTFIADARRWNPGAAATAPFVLHDAGSHALDLVAHVARRRIERVRATVQDGTDGCIVNIEAELAGGATAACRVGHAPRYQEYLAVTAAGRVHRAVASPGPLHRAKLAFCKITGRPTPTAESFRAQLAGFVAACRAEADQVGADAADGLASVAAVDAALRSLAGAGDWRAPTDPTGMGESLQ
ncbi:MAG TPA: Gfo/Idh/MocA family oxidoreductase [Gemmatimonadales bacterium]|nr:Gfo/Idh/MocA family oxidoreductase [Gemmatimonadales bacterium]